MIREMKETDLGEVLEIYNDAILHTTAVYDYRAHSLEDRKVWFNQKTEGDILFLFLRRMGKCLGLLHMVHFGHGQHTSIPLSILCMSIKRHEKKELAQSY